ncbi:MAG: HlyC/CorC family transporter [Spirochaetaceae bacterium]|nr:MAG: HlyC/CorC family transporter [Spirochaetaceae bacterium]
MIVEIVGILVLLALSGFFSGTETAFTSLSDTRIHYIRQKWGRRGELVFRATAAPERLLTTVLIGNNIVNIGASVMASALTIRLFGSAALAATTGILTLLVLVFGEVAPKQLAIVHNEWWTVHTVRLITLLELLLRPVVWAISSIAALITRLTGAASSPGITREGILYLVKHAEHVGILENSKSSMVRRVFRFGDVTVQAIMTHRTNVFSLDRETTIGQALQLISKQGYTRIPVYDGDPERIVGIAILRDILLQATQGNLETRLLDIMIEPIFVPETRKIEEMLTQFRKQGLNIAVVLDEFGGVAGIVTVEDVIEEILGEIYDEHEVKHHEPVTRLPDGTFRIMGNAPIYIINDLLDTEFPLSRSIKTLGGYLISRIGHIPAQGDVIETVEGAFTVESIAKRRIVSVRYRPEQQSEDEPQQ